MKRVSIIIWELFLFMKNEKINQGIQDRAKKASNVYHEIKNNNR